MTKLFRTYRRLGLPALLLLAGAAAGQGVAPSFPLSADPARAAYAPPAGQRALQRGSTALTLPFFDDFTTPLEGAPKAQNWLRTGGALVSNRLALAPPTRGAATLDGLRANGQSYSGSTTVSYGVMDSLASQPINLGSFGVTDGVKLSFAWQAGSIVGVPNLNLGSTPVRLELFVKTNAGAWERVWFYNSQRVRTGFRQQLISLNQAKYLHGDFQFMFVATGNTSDNSDTWGVDYVVLDSNAARVRNAANDTTFVDVATGAGLFRGNPSGGLRSPLRRFTAMPVWQFNAAPSPSSELNPALGVNLTNLDAGLPLIIDVLGTVRDRTSGALVGNWLQRTSRLVPTNVRQEPEFGPANALALPATATPKTLRYTLALNTQESTRRTQANDTISRDVELGSYYAFDDGTAERFTQLTPFPSGQQGAFAYRIDLNRPDYVRSLRLYPVYTASDMGSRPVTISVWGVDANGRPSATAVASKTATIPALTSFPAGWQYYEITFDQPVPVTGSFYVGFSQPSTGRFLHYGLDLNNSFPAGTLWARDNIGAWDSIHFVPRRGALMMRVVMTNNVTTATAAAREAAAFSLYPNPAHGSVTIAGPAFAHAAVLDALGRTVWAQPAGQAGLPILPLPALPPGVYTVRLTLTDGRTVGQRLLLE